ncbi:GNAT family N-acetyltransferase [Candidatus Pacearchaeota archaeon]|nr:GNAT family N-acetyltransferase [Candidatus Pacearchaeota archaeon]
MAFDFNFHGIEDRTDLKELIDFLAYQDLGYPRYQEWVQRTEHELDSGYKKAILAFSERYLVADLIYQQHKEAACFLELKNLRIHPAFRLRGFGRFMLRQVEVEHAEQYEAIICDARANQSDTIKFLESCGYSPLITCPLYDQNTPEIVMIKSLNKDKKQFIIATALDFIKPN